jgi:subtilase family serine protease
MTIDSTDFRLEPVRPVPALAANTFSTGTTTLTLPSVPVGTWHLLAAADDENLVAETQETNNVRSMTVLVGPDLNFLSVIAPGGAAGTSISVSATVRNSGAAPAPATVIRFYLSTNSILDAADTLLDAERQVPALATDATNAGSTSVPLPSGISGNYYLLAVADADKAVAEYSEANNTTARLIQITPGS